MKFKGTRPHLCEEFLNTSHPHCVNHCLVIRAVRCVIMSWMMIMMMQRLGHSGFFLQKNSSHSVQCVAAAPTVSHLGRKMALSKVSCWDSDQLPPCTCSFFVKCFDALVSHCEKHLETVIVLKRGVHVCVC